MISKFKHSAARVRSGIGRTLSYWQRFGTRATFQRLRTKGGQWLARKMADAPGEPPRLAGMPGHAGASAVAPASPVAAARRTFEQLVEPLAVLRTYSLPAHGRRRVTVVTDSIAKGSLFGGVGTALILATLVANRRDAELRIVTRSEPPSPSSVDQLLQLYGLQLNRDSEFRFVARDDLKQDVDLLPDELVISTSWWTTAAVLPSVPASQIVYLLQEDERMFYQLGDDHLRCSAIFANRDIRFLVNSDVLLQHLVREGFTHLQTQAMSFEAAFPPAVFHPRPKAPGAKRQFVFYARPKNPRNLFFLGIEVIAAAVRRGIFPADEWEICFMGRDIPELDIGGGHQIVRRENLPWSDYAELVGTADLGLSLMYTPHTSYPPLDLAASGAVVVTNRFGLKQDLTHLSANLICCEPTVEALVEGLRRGVQLATDMPSRVAHHAANGLGRDWNETLKGVVEQLAIEVR